MYIINRTPTPLLDNKTPFEILFKSKPNYTHLKVFGCLAFATTLVNGKHKFDPRARRCIFLGYPFRIKGYKLMDLETKKTSISRNVIFLDNVFPYKQATNTSFVCSPNLAQSFISRTPITTQSEFAINNPNPTFTNSTATPDQTQTTDTSSDTTNSPMPTQELNVEPFEPPSTSEPNTTPTQNQFSNQPLPRRSNKIKKDSHTLTGFCLSTSSSTSPFTRIGQAKGHNFFR